MYLHSSPFRPHSPRRQASTHGERTQEATIPLPTNADQPATADALNLEGQIATSDPRQSAASSITEEGTVSTGTKPDQKGQHPEKRIRGQRGSEAI